ncbi:SAM-dependent methyltransferase [Streptomyces sp. NPDC057909]|uniref:SAM-dependent methyltransferase n=1 Tax=Streptomyces sp. NPDC057909 TaxID=3346277 RepID=UPI0036EBA1C5
MAAQEKLLIEAAAAWGFVDSPPKSLLDIGCGLGGGAIYWASTYECPVTAVTNVADHVPVIEEMSSRAGTSSRIRIVNADMHDFSSVEKYSTAVAIESSCYMQRDILFEKVAELLEPGGCFGIEDSFTIDDDWSVLFDRYWKTRIGTLEEYKEAASKFGFTLEGNVDITADVTEFWAQSMAWNLIKLEEMTASGVPSVKEYESLRWHGECLRAWRDRTYETRLLRFRLNP